MELSEFKEVFEKVLDKKDYSELEKTIDNRLELEKDHVSQIPSLGSENLQKLVEELPLHYNEFKKLKQEKKELSKKFCDFVPRFDEYKTGMLLFLPSVCLGITSALFGICNANKGLPFIIMGAGGLSLFVNDLVHMGTDPKHYYNPLVLPVSAARYAKNKIRKRKDVKKTEAKLVNELSNAYQGETCYTGEWLRNETSFLKDRLSQADDYFRMRYQQVEKRLLPYHKIELHKEMEKQLSKDCEIKKYYKEGYEHLCKEICIAEETGLRVGWVKEKLLEYKKKVIS